MKLKVMTIPKIKKLAKEGYLAEIGQSMNLKMALLRKDGPDEYTQLTPHVKCRDFLCDVYSSDLEKCEFGIYGMKGLWPQHPDWTGVYLSLRFPNIAARMEFNINLAKLHELEKKNNRSPSLYFNSGDLEGIIIGDKAWLTNTLNFSLYTFLLRVLCYTHTDNGWLDTFAKKDFSDSKYVKSIHKTIWTQILHGAIDIIKTDEFCGLSFKADGTGAVHHNSGFISVFGSHTEINTETVRKNAHWKEMKARGFKLHTA